MMLEPSEKATSTGMTTTFLERTRSVAPTQKRCATVFNARIPAGRWLTVQTVLASTSGVVVLLIVTRRTAILIQISMTVSRALESSCLLLSKGSFWITIKHHFFFLLYCFFCQHHRSPLVHSARISLDQKLDHRFHHHSLGTRIRRMK